MAKCHQLFNLTGGYIGIIMSFLQILNVSNLVFHIKNKTWKNARNHVFGEC